MGKPDVAIKLFLEKPERFADLFNQYFFKGKPVIRPEELTGIDRENDFLFADKDGRERPILRYRDLSKKWNGKYILSILACEIQDKIHYAMPLRCMFTDSMTYAEQVKQIWEQKLEAEKKKVTGEEYFSRFAKGDTLYPVLTLVFYYSPKKWDGPVDLHGMFQAASGKGDAPGEDTSGRGDVQGEDTSGKGDMSGAAVSGRGTIDPVLSDEQSMEVDEEREERLRQFLDLIPNYPIHIIDLYLIEKQMKKTPYASDLQIVFGMLKYRKKKTELLHYMKENREYFQEIDSQTWSAIGVLMHSTHLDSEKLDKKSAEKEDEHMWALDELFQDKWLEGNEEGRKLGLAEGRKSGLAEGRKTGLAEGRKSGLAEGRKDGVSSMVFLMLKEGMEPSQVRKYAPVDDKEFAKILEKYRKETQTV